MSGPGTTDIEMGVIQAVKRISRRPVEPALGSDLVADLGFDSLEVLELVAELEDRFDISVPVEDVPLARTVAQVIAHVARLVGERAPRG
jgi:acyl carrier protein